MSNSDLLPRAADAAAGLISAADKSTSLIGVANKATASLKQAAAAGRFTQKSVAGMVCPSGKAEAFWWDASTRGLGLRALRSGRRSWVYQYRDAQGRTRRLALGDVTAVSLEAARAAARQHAGGVIQGKNPSAERRAARHSARLIDVVEEYLKFAAPKQKPKTYSETERYLRQVAKPLHHERVPCERAVIARWLEQVSEQRGAVTANRARAHLSAMWMWGMKTGRIGGEANPVVFTLRHEEMARERVLTDAEIKAIWAATDGAGDYDRIVRLLILSGCRREEIGSLRWGELGEDWITIGAGRMKAGATHEVPLLPAIAACLPERAAGAADACVFGRLCDGSGFRGWSNSKKAIDAKLAASGVQLPHWTLHDLRRSFSTRLHDAGIEPLVIEALLAHKQGGVAGRYNRASFREAKRSALGKWHEIVAGVVGGGA